jgi:hypothetical protein
MATVHTTAKRRTPADEDDPAAPPAQRARHSGPAAGGSSGGRVKPIPALVIWDLDETLILFNSLVTGSPPFPAAAAGAAATAAALGPAEPGGAVVVSNPGATAAGGDEDRLKQRGAALGARMESLIWSLLDHVFGFEQLEKSEYESLDAALGGSGSDSGEQSWLVGEGEGDTPLRRQSVSAASETPARRAGMYAQGFRKVAEGYSGGQRWLAAQPVSARRSKASGAVAAAAVATAAAAGEGGGAPREEAPKQWPFREGLVALRKEISELTGSWDCDARRALEAVVENGGTNVLVTASHLVAALGKLLLYDLDSFFPAATAVWSASSISKTDVFTRVVQAHLAAHGHVDAAQRYSLGSCSSDTLPAGFVAVVVGDGTEEEAAARRLQLPFVKIESARDLGKVCVAGRWPDARSVESVPQATDG